MLRTIALMGLRGSGKSTVGRIISERTSRKKIDLDARTALLLGCRSVREAWDRFGEVAFRAAETRALGAAFREPGAVIALGGGTPTAPGAAELLRNERDSGNCDVFYLRASAATLRKRLERADNTDRPSLTGADPLDEIEAVLSQRDGLYRSLASRTIDTEGRTPEDIAAEIE